MAEQRRRNLAMCGLLPNTGLAIHPRSLARSLLPPPPLAPPFSAALLAPCASCPPRHTEGHQRRGPRGGLQAARVRARRPALPIRVAESRVTSLRSGRDGQEADSAAKKPVRPRAPWPHNRSPVRNPCYRMMRRACQSPQSCETSQRRSQRHAYLACPKLDPQPVQPDRHVLTATHIVHSGDLGRP